MMLVIGKMSIKDRKIPAAEQCKIFSWLAALTSLAIYYIFIKTLKIKTLREL
jgi:hypothetical protein